MSKKLDNYLKTHRKRASLSQDEVAFLLGCLSGSKVSRYERGRREPNLRTALTYEFVFGIPLKVLFAGVFREVTAAAVRRAGMLSQRVRGAAQGRATDRKLAWLEALRASAGGDSSESA